MKYIRVEERKAIKLYNINSIRILGGNFYGLFGVFHFYKKNFLDNKNYYIIFEIEKKYVSIR